MRSIGMAAGILMAGLILGTPGSGTAAEDRTPLGPMVPTQREPSATASALDDAQGKSARPGDASSPQRPATAVSMPVYKPPLRGAPGGRVGGGSRGTENELPWLAVLAPDHVGLTTQEQPSLYWYLSKPTTYPLEVTLIEAQAVRPLLETRINAPTQPGVQRVRLADHGLRLLPGRSYRWFVTLVIDPANRSKDIIAGGALERTSPPAPLPARLDQAGRTEAPQAYAEAGLWYDAISALSDLIDTAPKDPALREQRASLLEQVGLVEVAQHERSAP